MTVLAAGGQSTLSGIAMLIGAGAILGAAAWFTNRINRNNRRR